MARLLVELTNGHLKEQHDGRTYDRDMILMMATWGRRAEGGR